MHTIAASTGLALCVPARAACHIFSILLRGSVLLISGDLERIIAQVGENQVQLSCHFSSLSYKGILANISYLNSAIPSERIVPSVGPHRFISTLELSSWTNSRTWAPRHVSRELEKKSKGSFFNYSQRDII